MPADGGDQRNAGGELAFSDIPQRVFRGNAAVLGNEQLQIAGRAGTVLIQGNRFGTTGGIDGGGLLSGFIAQHGLCRQIVLDFLESGQHLLAIGRDGFVIRGDGFVRLGAAQSGIED